VAPKQNLFIKTKIKPLRSLPKKELASSQPKETSSFASNSLSPTPPQESKE